MYHTPYLYFREQNFSIHLIGCELEQTIVESLQIPRKTLATLEHLQELWYFGPQSLKTVFLASGDKKKMIQEHCYNCSPTQINLGDFLYLLDGLSNITCVGSVKPAPSPTLPWRPPCSRVKALAVVVAKPENMVLWPEVLQQHTHTGKSWLARRSRRLAFSCCLAGMRGRHTATGHQPSRCAEPTNK
jgi:hypothetical protein